MFLRRPRPYRQDLEDGFTVRYTERTRRPSLDSWSHYTILLRLKVPRNPSKGLEVQLLLLHLLLPTLYFPMLSVTFRKTTNRCGYE